VGSAVVVLPAEVWEQLRARVEQLAGEAGRKIQLGIDWKSPVLRTCCTTHRKKIVRQAIEKNAGRLVTSGHSGPRAGGNCPVRRWCVPWSSTAANSAAAGHPSYGNEAVERWVQSAEYASEPTAPATDCCRIRHRRPPARAGERTVTSVVSLRVPQRMAEERKRRRHGDLW